MKHIFHNVDLSDRNSFHVRQSAATLVEFSSAEDLADYFSSENPAKWYVLGAGNNVLFTRDYDGVLLTPVGRQMTVIDDRGQCVSVRVDAGAEWDSLVEWSVGQGLWGLENLSLIPSSVGAAPVQNIGAYGAEAGDTITAVEYFDVPERRVARLSGEQCRFGYRDSIFKRELRGRAIITAVEFRLSRVAQPNLGYGDVAREVELRGGATLANIREAICAIRRRKLPDPAVTGNAGSFFKNPVVDRAVADRLLAEYADMPVYPLADAGRVKLAAGWLIDLCGLKGYRGQRVGVHDRQALVLVNLGGATGADVMALADMVCRRVEERFGIRIEPEVNVI